MQMTEQSIVISIRRDDSLPQFVRQGTAEYSQQEIMNNRLLLSNTFLSQRKKPGKKCDLRAIITKNKVNSLTKNFIKKLKRNSIYRSATDHFQDYQEQNQYMEGSCKQMMMKLSQRKGLVPNNIALTVWSFTNIIQITLMVFVFSIMLAFEQTNNFQIFLYFRIFSIVLYIADMLFNFITQRYESGRRLETLGQISGFYLRNGFIIDLVSILIFPLDLFVDSNVTLFISFVAIIKLANNLQKFQKFEYLYINTSQKQQYYGLVKVFLTNFAIGHFLSILLNLMTFINTDQNWTTKMGIASEAWYIKYIWGYYWGTNIMLTVGFGDISATSYYEAIILVFIQTFSCITLAYNINYVGAIIGSMRQKNQCKKKKLKTLHRMCKQNEVSPEIQTKISNCIEQTYRIKETFSYDEEDEVIQFLPKAMQTQYRKQSNRVLFNSLGFLSNLSQKSLLRLAQSVTRKICHPEQIVIKKGAISDFIIIQKGQLGLACKSRSRLDGKIIDTICVQQNNKPRIFSLDFIKNKICNFNVKSTKYSVLYYLSREQFMNSLRSSDMDFQLFCVLRDRYEFMIDENNLYECSLCKGQYHNKFECSRLHYFPLQQNVIFKSLQSSKKQHQSRKFLLRSLVKCKLFPSLNEAKQAQKKYIKNHYDEQQYEKIQNLVQFYRNIEFNRSIDSNQDIQKSQGLKKLSVSRGHRKSASEFLGDTKAIGMLQQLVNANKKKNSFWDMQSDQCHNFKYYLENSNPQNLNKIKRYRKTKITFRVPT